MFVFCFVLFCFYELYTWSSIRMSVVMHKKLFHKFTFVQFGRGFSELAMFFSIAYLHYIIVMTPLH